MKSFSYGRALAVLCFVGLIPSLSQATEDNLQLDLLSSGSDLELRWPGSVRDASGQTVWPLFEIQQSTDLLKWQPLGKAYRASSNIADQILRHRVPKTSFPVYYRLAGRLDDTFTASGGDAVLGYEGKLKEALQGIGQISPEEFVARYGYPESHYLPGLNWDPARSINWQDYKPIAGQDVAYPTNNPLAIPNILYFRLNEAEAKVFQRNGFVASERLGSYSFPEAFYQVYIQDRPVFVSADAILHAWHYSYLQLLEEMEEVFLAPSMEKILNGMATRLKELWLQSNNTYLKDSIMDADYFLTVARSLMSGSNVVSALGQDARVAQTLAAIDQQKLADFLLFGETRMVDFSQFTVRSHYENTTRLKNYFRMMMWCGRIDLRLTPAPPPWPPNSPSPEQSLRELGTAYVLYYLLTQSGHFNLWQQCDQVINNFVGWSESLTFSQLGSLLSPAGIQSPANLSDKATLQRLQSDLVSGHLGVQDILSDYYAFPLGPSQVRLPRSFAVLGQKFVLDSWALGQCVFPNVQWTDHGITTNVMRRIPSALDVGFSVFGNNDCVPELAARFRDLQGRSFRDGLPYQHHLAAIRQVIDQQSADSWDSNIYVSWLAALRDLSTPTTGAEYPACMRTHAWAMKNLNTQLASWTQLRYATVLYAKPSYTAAFLCSYPFGYVEPRPQFFRRLRNMAALSAELLSALPMQGMFDYGFNPEPFRHLAPVDLKSLQQKQIAFLTNFATVMETLTSIATKELAQQPLSNEESQFLKSLMAKLDQFYQGYRTYDGWYPGLFYSMDKLIRSSPGPGERCDKWTALVTDVHTDVPDPIVGDPGSILHEAVGNVWMLITAIDNGPDRMIYAGPVFSHYEFEQPMDKRLTDTEWKSLIRKGQTPPAPPWTHSYLVPGPYHVSILVP